MTEPSSPQLKAVITGAMGRMGQMFVRYLARTEGCAVFGATERPDHPDLGEDVGRLVLGRPLGVALESDLRHCVAGASAVIDFSAPEASINNARICADAGVALVCGTTGMSPEEKEEFLRYASRTRTVFAPNFSAGVTLLLALAESAAKAIGDDSDIEIVEAHHRHKEDAPSGTALALARAVAEPLGWGDDRFIYGREGRTGPREGGTIGIHAVRGGDVVGDHELHFLGEGEEVILRHRATSRETFVRGAVRAALWLGRRAPGVYSMRDVLGL